MMKKVLVTGANGFIGSSLVKKLRQQDIEVVGLVRKTSDLSFLEGVDVELVYGDIANKDTLDKNWFEGVDVVFHVAGLAADWGPLEKFKRVNFEGTVNVAKLASGAVVKRFVYISTVAFHGFGRTNIKETDPPAKNLIPYAATKLMAENWLWEFAKEISMEITAVRPGNVFGPNDRTFMFKYLKEIEKGKVPQINHGKSKTCPTFIHNLTDAIMLVSHHPSAVGEAFIVTDGLNITWNEFNKKLTEALGVEFNPVSIPYGVAMAAAKIYYGIHSLLGIKKEPFLTPYRINNGGKDYHFSIDKIKNILGFKPAYDLDAAVRMTVEWYKKHYYKK